jgi:hypothetical protein
MRSVALRTFKFATCCICGLFGRAFLQTDSSEEPEELLFFGFTSVVKKQILSSRASLVKLFFLKKKYLIGLQKK